MYVMQRKLNRLSCFREKEHPRLGAREGFKEEALFELTLEKQPGLGRGSRKRGVDPAERRQHPLPQGTGSSWRAGLGSLHPHCGGTEPKRLGHRGQGSTQCFLHLSWMGDHQFPSPLPFLSSVLSHVTIQDQDQQDQHRRALCPFNVDYSSHAAPLFIAQCWCSVTLRQCHTFSGPHLKA